ncbi:tRNA methyltransferase ppm2 [Diaporthe eres]
MIASDTLGRTSILNCMGLGPTTRLPSYDVYKLHGSGVDIRAKPTGPSSRATAISDAVMVFDPDKGWVTCEVNGSPTPRPIFGAMLTCSGREQEGTPTFHGFLIGGMSDGVIQSQILAWDLVLSDHEAPSITFKPVETDAASSTLLSRFGATCIQQEDCLVVLGGVGHDGVIPQAQEVLLLSMVGSKIQVTGGIPLSDAGEGQEISRPLIVGSSVVSPQNGQVVILGGGATCFSMGSFCWEFSGIGEIDPRPSSAPDHGLDSQPAEIRPIPRVNVSSKESFEHIVRQGSPVLIEGLDIGACRSKWTLDYLAEQVGDRQVVVHECNVRNMDFNAKNFRYTSMAFGDFAREVRNGARVYLRALSADAPANQPANLAHDFPSLAADFRLPEALNMCLENMHSSVLRVSGQVDMWLHYDVQANVYCQVSGSKRMLLFPPSDVVKMSFAPGSSSSSTDVFSRLGSPVLGGTHPWEASLKAGDVLFLPPLWLHAATPTSNASVAVNVFFRNLESGYSAGRDVYGNRDLAAYEKGRQEIARISKAFDGAPVEARQFYMLRLAGELAEAARADQ